MLVRAYSSLGRDLGGNGSVLSHLYHGLLENLEQISKRLILGHQLNKNQAFGISVCAEENSSLGLLKAYLLA